MTSVQGQIEHLLRALLKQGIEAAESGARPIGPRVHEMRVSLKKARALLVLAHPLLGRRARKVQRDLAGVARWVAAVRDAAVVLETFDRLTDAWRGRPPSTSEPRSRLAARRRELEEGERMDRDLLRAVHALRLARLRAKGILRRGHGRRAIADGFARGYRRARRAMGEAYRRDTPDAFHAWRKAVKAHGFHVRALAGAGVRALEARREPLDELGAVLGEAHDLALLEQALRAEGARSVHPRAYERLMAAACRRQRELYLAARPLGEHLFATQPRTMCRGVGDSLWPKGIREKSLR